MSVSWLKTGEESAKIAAQEKIAAEKRKDETGKAYRFFLKVKEERKILFVDGQLSKHGVLLPPRLYEHTVNFAGEWINVPCPEQTNPGQGEKCPICEGRDRADLVSLFTVIDLTPYTTKNGVSIPYSRKLYVAKQQVFEMLNKFAVALGKGGLRGQVFQVSRSTDKSARVGDVMIPIQHMTDEEAKSQFLNKFVAKDGTSKAEQKFEVLDYAKEITYRTSDQLRAAGFGMPKQSVGQQVQQVPASADDFKGEL